MAKQLFQSKAASIKKKMTLMVSSDMLERIEKIERRAEIAGVSFPLNKHVEDAISRLINAADKELHLIESDPQSVSSETVASLSDDDVSFQTNEFED